MPRGWNQIQASFPPDVLNAQMAVLELVKEGSYVEPAWHFVDVELPGVGVATFMMGGEPLRLGVEGDSVMVNVSHATTQQIADWLGWSTMTPFLEDVAVRFAQLNPGAATFIDSAPLLSSSLWGIDGTTTSTAHMVEHSQAIDARRKGQAFIAGPWKAWVASRRLELPDGDPSRGIAPLPLRKKSGLQYGLYSATAPSKSATGALHLWQKPGATHPVTYTDYSEKFRPLSRWVMLRFEGKDDPEWWDVYDLAADAELWRFVNHDGPVNMHHPWLPVCKPLSDGGGCEPGGGGKVPPNPDPKPGPRPVRVARFDWGTLAPLGAIAAPLALWALLRS